MIIPIGDENPTSIRPYVNWTIIGLNALVFCWTLGSGLGGEHWHEGWIVRNLALWSDAPAPVPLLTANFLHAGWLHLAGNMLMLWIMGDNVEERLGHGWYALVYLACGVVAMLAHLLLNFGAHTYVVGASGSIAGVMALYLLFFPNAQIKVLYWFFFVGVWYLPAKWLIGFYFAMDVYQALTAPISGGGGVAHFAHIGGFAAGVAVALYVKTKVEGGAPPLRPAPPPRPSRRGPLFGPAAGAPIPDGIDAHGRPFFNAPAAEPRAAAGNWNRGPAGSWTVLAASDVALEDPRALERAVASASGRAVPDVAASLRAERGFLIRGVSESDARRVVQQLNRSGIAAVARNESSLSALPPLAEVFRALFDAQGVEAETSVGAIRFAFRDVALAVVGRVRRAGGSLRPNDALVMTLFLGDGPRLLFVEHDTAVKVQRGAGMASGLPLRGQAVWVLNHAPSAGRNGGIEMLAGGRSRAEWEPYSFDGFAAYEAYTAWLWQLRGP